MTMFNPLLDARYVRPTHRTESGIELYIEPSAMYEERCRVIADAAERSQELYLRPRIEREQCERERDAELWQAAWQAVPAALRDELASAKQTLSEAQHAEGEAWVKLEAHREPARRPTTMREVDRWSERDVQLERAVKYAGDFAEQARTAYEQVAGRVLEILRAQLMERRTLAEQQQQVARVEAAVLRSQANEKERKADEDQQAVCRLHDRVFRQGIAVFEEVSL